MRTADQNKRAKVAYDTAYFVLPRYAHGEIERIKSRFEEAPDLGAMFYFVLAAKMRGEEPNIDDVRQLRGHVGKLETGWNYIVVEYPRFPAVDLLKESDVNLHAALGSHVLAPYFSAILEDRFTGEVRCFVLGQSPDAMTTLRTVTATTNANLGRGCEPELELFVDLLRQRTAPG